MKSLVKFSVATLAATLLVSCSTLNNLNPFAGGPDDEGDGIDRAGRIAMVSADEVLEPDPTLVSVAVILPDAVNATAWPQAGRTASKVTGHLTGGSEFEVDWRWGAATGSDNNRALTVPPVAADGRIFVIDADQRVFAVDATTGETVWRVELDSGNRRDQRADFCRTQHFVKPRPFNIENFTPKRQDGLVSAVPALLGRPASGITLDDE